MNQPLESQTPPVFSAAKQLLLDSLESRWSVYLAELQRCRLEFSNEAIHDLRVALRRLLSLMRLLSSVELGTRLKKLSRAFKDQLDEFDDLRDSQVMLEEIANRIQELPQLESFQEHLAAREAKFLGEIRSELEKLDLPGLTLLMEQLRVEVAAEEKDDLAGRILRSVDEAFAATKERYEQVDPTRPATIHRVRTSFKNFRYAVEIVHPLLEGFPEKNLKLMNNYQTLMGEIQDIEVFIRTLNGYMKGASSFDLELARGHYQVREADAVSAFIKKKGALKKFWRMSPEGPFPWEAAR